MRYLVYIFFLFFSSCDVVTQSAPPLLVKDMRYINYKNISTVVIQERKIIEVVETIENENFAVTAKNNFYWVEAIVTAYCPCARCCGKMRGITATGSNAWKPGAAADFRVFSPGTKISVPDYDRAVIIVIDDTGAAMRKSWDKGIIQIDVRMTYHWQARQWGRKKMLIKVWSD